MENKAKKLHIIQVIFFLLILCAGSGALICGACEGKTSSELEKRETAIKLGFIHPQYTAEAYFDLKDNSLLSLAIAKTSDIYECHKKGLFRICNGRNEDRDVTFHGISWEVMKSKGYKVYDWYKDETYRREKTYETSKYTKMENNINSAANSSSYFY